MHDHFLPSESDPDDPPVSNAGPRMPDDAANLPRSQPATVHERLRGNRGTWNRWGENGGGDGGCS